MKMMRLPWRSGNQSGLSRYGSIPGNGEGIGRLLCLDICGSGDCRRVSGSVNRASLCGGLADPARSLRRPSGPVSLDVTGHGDEYGRIRDRIALRARCDLPGDFPCRIMSTSRGGLGRRQFLAARRRFPRWPGCPLTYVSAQEPKAAAGKAEPNEKWGIPGPYPGRVIEVRNPRMIKNDVKNREAIQATVARGMKELTGADDAVEAWRSFFEPGDVVGIKMNPVGNPLANSSSELMLEVIDGLKAAGVKTRDIVVFERYRDEFIDAKMHEAVPTASPGPGWGSPTTASRSTSRGTTRTTGNLDRVTGYDPDEFMVMELRQPGDDPKDDRTRRSHLGLLVTRRVNKIVLLPVLKDHGSAGVTGGLKNMSHGWSTTSAGRTARPTPTSATSSSRRSSTTRSSAGSASCRSWTGSRASTRGARSHRGPNGPGRTTPCSSRPTRWRWTTSPGDMIDAKRKEKGLPPGRRRRQAGPRPAEDRGLRHPPAPAHRPGRQPRPGHLRFQLAQGEAARDPAPGRSDLRD